MSEALAELFRHNLWANLRLLDACAALPDEQLDAQVSGTYGTARSTLFHMAAAESRYVILLRGQERDPRYDERGTFPGISTLREWSQQSGEALIEIAAGYEPGRILRGTWRDQPYEMRAIVPLMQAINHATEHRAHVVTTLTAQGLEMPSLDVWAYNEESGSS